MSTFDQDLEALVQESGKRAVLHELSSFEGVLPNVISLLYYADDYGEFRVEDQSVRAKIAETIYNHLGTADKLQIEKYIHGEFN